MQNVLRCEKDGVVEKIPVKVRFRVQGLGTVSSRRFPSG